jgi:hypothetical protein
LKTDTNDSAAVWRAQIRDGPLAPLDQKKPTQRCTKTETGLKEKKFKKQMDSQRKQEGDGFPRSKKLTRRVQMADATMELVVVLGLRVFPLQFMM